MTESDKKKVDLSSKTVLCYDQGLFAEMAVRLSRDFGKVYYYTPWVDSFPNVHKAWIGKGVPGIERIDNIWDYIDDVDLFYFADIYDGSLQLHLESLGKPVWGMRKAEELELHRDLCKDIQKELGLPVNKYEIVNGVAELRNYLKSHKEVWVKLNVYRGATETFFSPGYRLIEPKIDELEYKLGAFKNEFEFIVEENLPDRVEVGFDGYVIDGQYPDSCLGGIEVKDVCYVSKFQKYAQLPKEITTWNNAFAPIYKQYGSRGFFSTEIRVGKDHVPYQIDACERQGSPPSELYQEMFENISEIVWEGAHGNLVSPVSKYKYGAEVLIHSSWADKNWAPIYFPDEYRNNIKLRNLTVIDGRYYVIPQAQGLPEIGAIVGWGNTMDEAINMCKEIAEAVEGYDLDIKVESFDKASEEIEKTEKMGIRLF